MNLSLRSKLLLLYVIAYYGAIVLVVVRGG